MSSLMRNSLLEFTSKLTICIIQGAFYIDRLFALGGRHPYCTMIDDAVRPVLLSSGRSLLVPPRTIYVH